MPVKEVNSSLILMLLVLQVVSDAVKDKIKEREAEAAKDAPISDMEVTAAKATLCQMMESRETVMQALKRVSARPKGEQV